MKRFLNLALLLSGFQLLVFSQGFYPNQYLKELDEKYTSGLFRGGQAHYLVPMYDLSAHSSLTVFQYLQGRVPGLIIYSSQVQRPYISYRMGMPALFLDEMQVDANLLSGVPMTDIAFIKVFPPPFMGSGRGGNGAIAVYTRQGDEE